MKIDELIEKYSKPSIFKLAGTNISIVETKSVVSNLLELKEELMKEPVNVEYSRKELKYDDALQIVANTHGISSETFMSLFGKGNDFEMADTRIKEATGIGLWEHVNNEFKGFEHNQKEEFQPIGVKVKVPQFVADTMKLYKDLREMLTEEYYNNSIEEIDNDNIFNWIDNNFEIFCQAWLHGHEVKEEPKYYWKLVEHPKFMSGATYLGTFDGSGPKLVDKGAEDMSEVSKWKTRFTEKEVRELLGEDISRFIDEPARLGL